MRVELSRFVEGDLDAIAEYIAQDNPSRAVTFIQEIGAQIDAIGKNPLLYHLRPEIGPGARMAIVGRYVILFRTIADAIRIERVVYGGRDLLDLFRRGNDAHCGLLLLQVSLFRMLPYSPHTASW